MSATMKKQKTVELPKLPKISDSVEEPVAQTLATVCAKLYDEALFAAWKPKDDSAPDDNLAQPYKLSKEGGQYNKGGKYKLLEGGKYEYLNGKGDVVKGFDVFNHSTIQPVDGKPYGTPSLAQYGKVIDGFTDFHGVDQATIPPFAALIVQPKDETEAPILILAWRGSVTVMDWVNDVAFSPTLSSRWSSETKEINAHGAYTNLVENTFSRHEDAIVALVQKERKDTAGKAYLPVKCAFITGHSLGGGIANVAHLVVRAQLKKPGSPWYKLVPDKVTWTACTFASPSTIVRLYEHESKPKPPLMAELDASSYNVVYGCDCVPRLLGMLNYVGALVEIAVPEYLEAMGEDAVKEAIDKTIGFKIPDWVPGVLKGLIEVGHFLAPKSYIGDLGGKIDEVTDEVTKELAIPIKFLKDNGLAEVLRQFSHTGTVVFVKDKALECVHLKGAEIKETLDVGGDEFRTLLGKPADILTSLKNAHTSSYSTFMFGGREAGWPK